jgi:hypothetical protein
MRRSIGATLSNSQAMRRPGRGFRDIYIYIYKPPVFVLPHCAGRLGAHARALVRAHIRTCARMRSRSRKRRTKDNLITECQLLPLRNPLTFDSCLTFRKSVQDAQSIAD